MGSYSQTLTRTALINFSHQRSLKVIFPDKFAAHLLQAPHLLSDSRAQMLTILQIPESWFTCMTTQERRARWHWILREQNISIILKMKRENLWWREKAAAMLSGSVKQKKSSSAEHQLEVMPKLSIKSKRKEICLKQTDTHKENKWNTVVCLCL